MSTGSCHICISMINCPGKRAFKIKSHCHSQWKVETQKGRQHRGGQSQLICLGSNKENKILSEKGIGAPLTHTFTRNSRPLCQNHCKLPPRSLYISRVGTIENISRHAIFCQWDVNRSQHCNRHPRQIIAIHDIQSSSYWQSS